MAKKAPKTIEELIADDNEEAVQFYAAMGRAISGWAGVEHILFIVFLQAMGCPEYGTAAAAYHAVVNFGTKLDMVDAALSIRFKDTQVLEEWSTLYNLLLRKAKKRNKVAHYNVVHGFKEKPGRRHWLQANISDPKNTKWFTGVAAPRIYESDLIAYVADFNKCASRVGLLKRRLELDYKLVPFPVSSAPAGGPH